MPPLLALLLYWPGLVCWFQKDDFAWLGLEDMLHQPDGLWTVLFHPFAQGTVRTLSERVFYTSFHALFGMNALPYRIWAFVTFAAAATMLSLVAIKLTGSRAAGFWAAVLWIVNAAIALPLAWTAIYYELLCSFNFLLSLWLLIRYAESGNWRYYLAQWLTFLIGFGILEQNVVYPALAAAYAWCCCRRILGQVLPMFIASAAYTVLHLMAAPLAGSGPYKMYWDAGVFTTFWTYWKVALGPSRLILLGIHPSLGRSTLTAALTVGLVGFLVLQVRRREWVTTFFAAWFLIVLAPLLPLKDHFMEYYLTIPLIGLAMWGSWALVCGWRKGRWYRIAAAVLLAIYSLVAIPLGRVSVLSFYDRSIKIRALVLGVVEQSRIHPGKAILLTGVEPDLFWSSVYHRPFRLYGLDNVRLMPEEQDKMGPQAQDVDSRGYFLSRDAVQDALRHNRAIIYDVSGGEVRDVTGRY